MAEESDQEKTEEPSAHRIEESKRKGEVAQSKELTSVLVLSACMMTLGLSIVFIYEEMDAFVRWLAHLDIATAFTEKSLKTIAHKTARTALVCAAPVSIVAMCMGIIANVGQIGFIFASATIWNVELRFLQPFSWIIGAIFSSITYYLLASK